MTELITKIRGAEAVIKCLKEENTEYIFGYPGGAIMPIYDALYDYPEINHVLSRHEQGAIHAAQGLQRAGHGGLIALLFHGLGGLGRHEA